MNAGELVMALFNARTVAHVAHLQTKSYAVHVALKQFYEALPELADRFAETYQGLYGPIKFGAANFKLESDPVKMLRSLRAQVEKSRAECDCPSLQQICDDMVESIGGTLFLLTLK